MTNRRRRHSQLHQARDPSAPAARLLALLPLYPDEVLANPALALLAVEQPDLWRGLDGRVHRLLAQHPACPIAFASWALRQPTRQPLEWNRALPRDLRRQAFLRWGHREPDLGPRRKPLAEALLLLEELLTPLELSVLKRSGWLGPGTAAALSDDERAVLASLGG